jgi:hypothetical protein
MAMPEPKDPKEHKEPRELEDFKAFKAFKVSQARMEVKVLKELRAHREPKEIGAFKAFKEHRVLMGLQLTPVQLDRRVFLVYRVLRDQRDLLVRRVHLE